GQQDELYRVRSPLTTEAHGRAKRVAEVFPRRALGQHQGRESPSPPTVKTAATSSSDQANALEEITWTRSHSAPASASAPCSSASSSPSSAMPSPRRRVGRRAGGGCGDSS